MFSADSDLSEEDFLEAALLIEADVEVKPRSVSSEAKLQLRVELPSLKEETAAIADPGLIFCLSQNGCDDNMDDFSLDELPLCRAVTCDAPVVPTEIVALKSAHVLRSLHQAADVSACHALYSPQTTTSVASSVHSSRSVARTLDNADLLRRFCSDSAVTSNCTVISSTDLSTAISTTSSCQTAISPQVESASTSFIQPVVSAATRARLDGSLPVTEMTRRKRKFPGPAGVLPKLKPGINLDEVDLPKSASTNTGSPKKAVNALLSEVPSSQTDCFSGEAWQLMLSDLEPHADLLLTQFCIREIIRMANAKQLPRGKVPVVCAAIESVTARGADAGITLRDPTGSISASIHRDVIKEYSAYLHPGTIVVLRQVGVLSPLGRNFYLNVTPNNLVHLYPHRDRETPAGSPPSVKIRNFAVRDLEIHDSDRLPVTELGSLPCVSRSSLQCTVSPSVNSMRSHSTVVGSSSYVGGHARQYSPSVNYGSSPRLGSAMPRPQNHQQVPVSVPVLVANTSPMSAARNFSANSSIPQRFQCANAVPIVRSAGRVPFGSSASNSPLTNSVRVTVADMLKTPLSARTITATVSAADSSSGSPVLSQSTGGKFRFKRTATTPVRSTDVRPPSTAVRWASHCSAPVITSVQAHAGSHSSFSTAAAQSTTLSADLWDLDEAEGSLEQMGFQPMPKQFLGNGGQMQMCGRLFQKTGAATRKLLLHMAKLYNIDDDLLRNLTADFPTNF